MPYQLWGTLWFDKKVYLGNYVLHCHWTQHVWNVLGLEKSPKHLGASKWVNQVFIIKNNSKEKV